MALVPDFFPVTCNSKRVTNNSTFVAINGYKEDGNAYIWEAIQNGASHIVLHDKNSALEAAIHTQAPHVSISYAHDIRKKLAELAAHAAGNPAEKLRIIGITGTKGKSTTTNIIFHILKQANKRVALIGGITNRIMDEYEDSSLTTPDCDYLQQFLATCVQKNVEFVVMEVSSHALSLDRVHGIFFDAVGFTNFSLEHLDFYTTLDNYFAAKMLIFNHVKKTGISCINTDDEWGKKALKHAKNNTLITLSTSALPSKKSSINQHSLTFEQFGDTLTTRLTNTTSTIILKNKLLFGTFNGYNLAMAYLITTHLGIASNEAQDACASFQGTPGRLQLHILKNGAKAFVDHAHNGSSMAAIMQTLRPLTKHLIVVFGCGGDRDPAKRPLIGAFAAQYADRIIITNDNPRTENPSKIIDDILHGIAENKRSIVTIIQDRKEAIMYAAHHAKPDSIIAILGKGHEKYQLINNAKIPHNDLEIISFY